jgi:TLD
MDVKRATIIHAPDSMLARLFSGRWDHVLPLDKRGRIFLDLDLKWVKPILQHLYHLSIASAATASEPLITPEKQFDGDDLVGYYATLDLFGLTKTFNPTGVVRHKPTVEQMPFGTVNPHEFVSNMNPVTTSSRDWNAPWKILYKSSRDGSNFETYKDRCRNASNTVVFVKEKSTGNVYGGYTGVAKTFGSGVWRSSTQDPNMFIFAITGTGASAYTKFSNLIQPQYASYDSSAYAFYIGDLYMQGLSSKCGATARFNYMDKGLWPHAGLNSSGKIHIEQLEVWQIPDINSSSNTVPDIFDPSADIVAHDDICILPANTTDSMTFRDDMSALAAPVTSLSSGLQSWLHGQLQKLDEQMTALSVEEKKINDEQDFMSYHFPDTNTSDTTDSTTTNKEASSTTATITKSSNELVKGVYKGIVYTVLHGELICTTQVTAEELKSNWLSDVTAADINSDGYIVQEFDYECFRKLINVIRLKSMLKSPQCKLPKKVQRDACNRSTSRQEKHAIMHVNIT